MLGSQKLTVFNTQAENTFFTMNRYKTFLRHLIKKSKMLYMYIEESLDHEHH